MIFLAQESGQVDLLPGLSKDHGPIVFQGPASWGGVPAGLAGGLDDGRDLRRQVLDERPKVDILVPGDEPAIPDDPEAGPEDEEKRHLEPVQDPADLEQGGLGFGHCGLPRVA